jgi:heme-degrading monooxygenase HmoA
VLIVASKMYMNVMFGRLNAGMWSEYETVFLKADAQARDLPGLLCRWLLRDLDDADHGFTMSLWQSEADLDRYLSDATVRSLRETKFESGSIGHFFRHICEVRVVSPGSLERLTVTAAG